MSMTETRKAKLELSQLNAITGDIDLTDLNLALKGFASQKLIEAVTDADVERTIEGASTFTVGVADAERILMYSPYLASDVYTEVDGLWFALVGVSKTDDEISLTFEDREVYLMRKYNKPKTAAWGKTTRPKFIREMVREVKEQKIRFFCPELESVKLIGPENEDTEVDLKREPGFAFSANVTVKGRQASAVQKQMISRVLRVGIKMKARRKVLVTSIMTITQESTATNLSGGHLDSAGLFQQRPSQGWGTHAQVTNPEYAAREFFKRAIANDALFPNFSHSELAQSVQRSAYPDAYAKWRTESERTVKTFGIFGDSNASQAASNNQVALDAVLAELGIEGSIFLDGAGGGADYQFARGMYDSKGGLKKREDSWDCSGRLADEVAWRRFMVNGTFYYVSEPYLFRSKPRMVIGSEFDPAIIKIDFKYDTGQHNAEVTIVATTTRWAAPPGSVVMLESLGVINGRWLVTNIKRSLFSPVSTITLKKPRPKLPEPTQDDLEDELGDTNIIVIQTAGLVGGFVSPLATDGNLAVSEFDMPDPEGAPNRFGVRYHAAKDWFAPGGSPLVAPIGGTLIELKQSKGNSGQVFGGVVKLQMDNGYVWVFRHVNPVLAFKVGARVTQGQTIATVTKWTDKPASSHAHIEIWRTLEGGYKYENMIDPCKFLKGEAS